MNQVKFKEVPTFLSPKVKYILCGVKGAEDTYNSEQNIIEEGVIDFSTLASILKEEDDSEQYFLDSVHQLRHLMGEIRQQMESEKYGTIRGHYNNMFRWTSSPNVFDGCLGMLQEKDPRTTILVLLLCTAVLERSLGDLYLLEGSQCPSMLKDLLVTPELLKILGPDMLKVLRVFIGPPISLNLRNVVWHGFPSHTELSAHYPYFMLCIVASIGRLLTEKGFDFDAICHRNFLTLPQIDEIEGSLPDIHENELEEFHSLYNMSPFVPKLLLPMWNYGLEMFSQERYGECLAIMLPQLENGLRRVFAACNNCQDRILTAESTTLFTTFDEILARKLPDETENKIFCTVGPQTMDMIFDLLVYPEGLRVRDRISHGEMCFADLPKSLASHVINICNVLCLQCLPDGATIKELPQFQEILKMEESYQVKFYSPAIYRKQILCLSESLERWEWLATLTDPSVISSKGDLTAEGQHKDICEAIFILQNKYLTKSNQNIKSFLNPYGQLGDIQSYLESANLSAADSNQLINQEMLGILRRITKKALETSEQIQENVKVRQKQFEQKELRSRQRTTYKRMLMSIPPLSHSLRLVLLFQICQYNSVHNWLYTLPNQTTLKCLKNILQACENLYTFTSIDKNKWQETETVINNMVQNISHL